MEAQTAQPLSDPSSGAYPRWVLLEKECQIDAEGSSCSPSGDAGKTSAAARTRDEHPIHVSLRLAEPPAVSCVCVQVQIPHGREAKDSVVVAAHGDFLLISVTIIEQEIGYAAHDHFVYNAGDAAAEPPRLPSLSLLPPFNLSPLCTGLVRCGEDELVVADLSTVPSPARSGSGGRGRGRRCASSPRRAAEADVDLSLFRGGEWSIRRLPVRIRNASEVQQLPSLWNAAVPVGDGLLCWIDLYGLSVVLCDVFEETPRPLYLPLPRENICGPPSNRNVCATAGGDALKFVNIFPRCCCGSAGASNCAHSCHAYTIDIWTLRIDGSGDDGVMEWVKDGIVDASELWALDAYKGLRRLPLDHPLVSLDDPDHICFWLHEPPVDGYWDYRDGFVDLLMVNTRSKTIHSVSRHEDGSLLDQDGVIPCNVSYFFNSYQSSGSDGTLTGQRQKSVERRLASITTDPMLQPASLDEPSVRASEIFEIFQEIPSYGLDHDEAKVYRILRRDNCRRFRSLLRLPKNLRKDWLLMEINKAREE